MDAPTYLQQPIDPRIVPQPPRLHWAVVAVLSALTRSLFGEVWLVVQANWIRKVTGRSEPLTWAIVNLCTIPFLVFSALIFGIAIALTGQNGASSEVLTAVGILTGIAIFAVYVVTVFKVRSALESEAIGLPLGGVMTFFFGSIYFQYFLHDYVTLDAVDVYGPIAPAPAYVPATSPEA